MAKKLLILFLILSICVCFSMQTVFATEVETTEPTEPTTPPTDTGNDDMPKWLSGFLESIGNMFANVTFRPIIDFVESLASISTKWEEIIEVFNELLKHVGEDFIEPVSDFFDSLASGALAIFREIWEFPIIKDYILAFVSVCVVGGIVIFITTI